MKQINYYGLLTLLLIGLIIGFLLRSCSDHTPKNGDKLPSLKVAASNLKHEEKQAKDSVQIKEVVRTKYLIRWKEVRHDSLIPCETKLLVSDTVIMRDSYLISSLKEVIRIDSLLIIAQDSIIKIDSIALRSKKKFWKGFKFGYISGVATGALIMYR